MSNLFELKTDIPLKHLRLFMVCNSKPFAGQQQFYTLKKKMLEKYGHADGYDLQIVKKKCWSCAGTGIYDKQEDIACYKCCGTGIYDTRYYILKRYILNGNLFYVPVDDINAVSKYKAKCKNTIEGLVTHKDVPGNPLFCYGVLLYIYDQNEFFIFIGNYGKMLNTQAKHKWKEIMKASKSTLHGFYSYFNLTLKEHQPDNIEDLPF